MEQQINQHMYKKSIYVQKTTGVEKMNHLLNAMIRFKKQIVVCFLVAAAICAFLSSGVKVNYNMVDYLPDSAPSTKALDLMDDEFDESVPNARVMIKDTSVAQAMEYKEKLENVKGVSDVTWLDDVIDIKKPLETQDQDTVDDYYKDRNAVISLSIEDGKEVEATDAIYKIIGKSNALAGEAVDTAASIKGSSSEITGALGILLPIIVILLLITTTSYVEPFLFLAAIGVSVLLNMGTNLIFGEVSFVTNAVGPILQLAVSLDYAIFLLNSFKKYREELPDIDQAMKMAVRRSFSSIMASATTTLFGFMALMFMKFKIGADLGTILVKGIFLSFISVIVFLPCLTLCCYKLLDKTKHKEIFPKLPWIGNKLLKLRIPVFLLVMTLLVPCYLGQGKTDFKYGTGEMAAGGRNDKDAKEIEKIFGKSNAMVIMVPKGDVGKEAMLSRELGEIDHVTSVLSYAKTVGSELPVKFLDQELQDKFYSEHYARIVLDTDTEQEGEEAFALVEKVQNKAEEYYGDQVHSCGSSINLYDMKHVIDKDNKNVNMLSILAIAAVLLLTFKSLSFPLILLLTIEAAIWINLSVPYFTGDSINFLGYLVINTVQLGATVDYAILFSDHYREKRVLMPKKKAAEQTLTENFESIFTSASILTSAGLCLNVTSSNPIIGQLGMLLARGTFLSFLLVLVFLPGILIGLDSIVEKTTLGTRFYHKNEERKSKKYKLEPYKEGI